MKTRAVLAALALPFRVGATSEVIPSGLVENAAYLAQQVDDMQLVLFDVPDGPCNIPPPAAVAELARIGRHHDLSYTVHLIHDLVAHDPEHHALRKATDVIERTRALRPHAYVLHLDGKSVRSPETPATRITAWQQGQARALHRLARATCDIKLLAVENLEGYAPDFVMPPVRASGAGRCVDVGHLWLDGHNPLPELWEALPCTRVVHIHGVQGDGNERTDHCSLACMSPQQLDPVVDFLLRANFAGVLTLEVFEEADFETSLAALVAAVQRVN